MRLQRIVEPDHAEVWVKVEGMNPGGSIKDRPALAMVVDAEKKGLLKPGDMIVEPTSGNTGVGLAQVAAVRGYRLVLCMPSTMSFERKKTLAAFSAEGVFTEEFGSQVEISINLSREGSHVPSDESFLATMRTPCKFMDDPNHDRVLFSPASGEVCVDFARFLAFRTVGQPQLGQERFVHMRICTPTATHHQFLAEIHVQHSIVGLRQSVLQTTMNVQSIRLNLEHHVGNSMGWQSRPQAMMGQQTTDDGCDCRRGACKAHLSWNIGIQFQFESTRLNGQTAGNTVLLEVNQCTQYEARNAIFRKVWWILRQICERFVFCRFTTTRDVEREIPAILMWCQYAPCSPISRESGNALAIVSIRGVAEEPNPCRNGTEDGLSTSSHGSPSLVQGYLISLNLERLAWRKRMM